MTFERIQRKLYASEDNPHTHFSKLRKKGYQLPMVYGHNEPEVLKNHELGNYIIAKPFHENYSGHQLDVIPTRRNLSFPSPFMGRIRRIQNRTKDGYEETTPETKPSTVKIPFNVGSLKTYLISKINGTP